MKKKTRYIFSLENLLGAVSSTTSLGGGSTVGRECAWALLSTLKRLQLWPQFALTRPQLTPYSEQPTKAILMKWNSNHMAEVFSGPRFSFLFCLLCTLLSSMMFLFLCNLPQTQAPCTCPLSGVPKFLSPYKSDPKDSTESPQWVQELYPPRNSAKQYARGCLQFIITQEGLSGDLCLWPVGPTPVLCILSWQQLGDPWNFAFSFLSSNWTHKRES